jgi:hypothetical protein
MQKSKLIKTFISIFSIIVANFLIYNLNEMESQEIKNIMSKT